MKKFSNTWWERMTMASANNLERRNTPKKSTRTKNFNGKNTQVGTLGLKLLFPTCFNTKLDRYGRIFHPGIRLR